MKIRSQSDVLQRLPCLVAHLICESLGYYTPQAAANAVVHFLRTNHSSANGITTGHPSGSPAETQSARI